MGRYVRRIAHKGKSIVFMDTPGLNEVQGIEAWEEMRQVLAKETNGCLILVDSRNIIMSPAAVNKAKEAASALRAHPGNRVAFVGLTRIQKTTALLMAKGLRVDAYCCDSMDEAREWLVKETIQVR